MRRWLGGWKGQGVVWGRQLSAWGRRGGRWGMTAPMGLAEVVPREAKGHGRGSNGKGNGGQEAWGRGSKVTSEPGRELGPGHWDGE